MGFLADDEAELAEAVDSHGEKIAAGIDKAGDLIDDRTRGHVLRAHRVGQGQGCRRPGLARREERRHQAVVRWSAPPDTRLRATVVSSQAVGPSGQGPSDPQGHVHRRERAAGEADHLLVAAVVEVDVDQAAAG